MPIDRIDRRVGIEPKKQGANRASDKLFSFIFFILLVFLINILRSYL